MPARPPDLSASSWVPVPVPVPVLCWCCAGVGADRYLALHNTHGPIEAPPEWEALYSKRLSFPKQITFDAMVSVVDSTVGNVTAALKQAGLWENTLFVWTTDNGSPVRGPYLIRLGSSPPIPDPTPPSDPRSDLRRAMRATQPSSPQPRAPQAPGWVHLLF